MLAQPNLDFVGCSGILLVNHLLLLFVRKQDVSALVASATFKPRLRLLVVAITWFDILACERSGILRLRKLLPILRCAQLLVLHWKAAHFILLMLDLVRVLALYHHFLIDEKMRMIVHQATRRLVIV